MDAPQAALLPQPAVYESLRNKAGTELGEDAQVPRSLFLRIEGVVVGGLAFLALALCSYNVVMRYFHPAWVLELVDEVQVYVVVWATFLALAMVTLSDRHVKADLFVSFFPQRLRHAIEVFIDLLGLGFALILLWYGGIAAHQAWSYGDVSITSLRFPLWIYVAALPAGGLALAFGYATRLARHSRRRA
jgi:C4-dicarboxylate transporter DctQ subunit